MPGSMSAVRWTTMTIGVGCAAADSEETDGIDTGRAGVVDVEMGAVVISLAVFDTGVGVGLSPPITVPSSTWVTY